MYELTNVRHLYQDRPVLEIDNLTLPAGTITGLAGPNGSGKSTLLRLLGFVERPSTGRILFEGRQAEPFSEHVRARVILLPQQTYLLKRSVASNVAYGLALGNGGHHFPRIAEALGWVGLDAARFANRPWYALSGGEARRVALAARLALKPKVLLLDEPTASVDALSAQSMKQAVTHARRQWGATLIIVSHDTEWLQDICDTQLHLFRGRITGSIQPTLFFGPWHASRPGLAVKELNDGQQLLAAGAPHDLSGAVAALDPDNLLIGAAAEASPANHCRLRGTLMRMGLDKPTGRTTATVNAGDTLFMALLSPRGVEIGTMIPGQSIWISYDPAKIIWHA